MAQPQNHPTGTVAATATLLVSFKLSEANWVVTIRQPGGCKLSRFGVPARDTAKLLDLLATQGQQAERRSNRG